MSKITLLAGIAIGFVIGAAVGRERFDQLKDAVTDVANKPQVQRAVKKADDFVADKAPAVHDVAHDLGGAAVDAVKPDSPESSDSSDETSTPKPGPATAGATS